MIVYGEDECSVLHFIVRQLLEGERLVVDRIERFLQLFRAELLLLIGQHVHFHIRIACTAYVHSG